jgi:hypothetical protein
MAFVYKSRANLKIGATTYGPGDEITEAGMLFNLFPWLHSGQIELMQTDVEEVIRPAQRVPLAPDMNELHFPGAYYQFDNQQRWGWGSAG